MFEDEEVLQKTREAKQRLEQRRIANDFKWLMGDVRGRRIVWGQLSDARIFHTTFDTHGGRMSMNEGERRVGLRLLDQINRLCPDLYAVMVKENTTTPEVETDD